MPPHSLRIRVNVAILAACVVVALLFGLLLYPFESRRRQAGLKKIELLLTVLYEQNETALANEVFAGQDLALNQTLNGIVSVEGITSARVSDTDGKLLMGAGPGARQQEGLLGTVPVGGDGTTFREIRQGGSAYAVFTTPIEVIGERVGYFSMAYDLTPLKRETMINIAFFTAMLLSILLIMSALLNFILSRFFIKRISLLREGIRRVQEGRFGETVQVVHQDEIGDVTEAFNAMSLRLMEQHDVISAAIQRQKADARELAESNRALERLNAELETKVADRTADLLETNEQLKKFKTISDRASYGNIITGLDGKVLYVNEAFAAMHGYRIDEVEGRHLSVFHTPDQLEQVARLAECFRTSDGFSGEEVWHVKKDGEVFPSLMNTSLIRDSEGNPLYYSSTAIDISLRKSLEEKLLLRQRIDSLGTLAGGIAHDFNNILSGVTGYLDLLAIESEGLSDDQKRYLENAQTSVQRAAELIRRFQRLSKGSLSRRTAVDVHDIAREVFAMVETPGRGGLRLEIAFSEDRYYVVADPSELHQVLLNLVLNARDAIDKSGPAAGGHIGISAEDYRVVEGDGAGLAPGEYVHICVSDDGCGMSDRVRQKAFDPLFTTKDRYHQRGQGLGLAMVFTIVQRHGGMVSVDSTEGEGARFHIFLRKGVSDTASLPRPASLVKGTETVLIIDDEESVRNLAETVLTKLGYTVLTAADGAQGLDLLNGGNNKVDLVLLDLTMPGISGEEVLERISCEAPSVAVVILSGHSRESLDTDILSLASGHLPKPFQVRDLSVVVRQSLDRLDGNPDFTERCNAR
jgi:PAS domain S-box-containing protein